MTNDPEKVYNRFRADVDRWLVLSGIHQKRVLAQRIQMHERTLHRRIRDPGDFTVAELRRLSRALGMPWEECAVLLQ